jgi:hypothetical protein
VQQDPVHPLKPDRSKLRGAAGWTLPDGPWVLHTTKALGSVTDRWSDLQAARGERFEARLLGWYLLSDARRAHWLVASDHPGAYVAARGMRKSRELSSACLYRYVRDRPPAIIHVHYALAFRGVPGARLLTVGGGPLEERYRALAASEGIADQRGRAASGPLTGGAGGRPASSRRERPTASIIAMWPPRFASARMTLPVTRPTALSIRRLTSAR